MVWPSFFVFALFSAAVAAARSCIARPTDLKKVISSGEVLAGAVPVRISPSSA